MARKSANSTSKEIIAVASTQDMGGAAKAILDFVSKIPASKEPTSRLPDGAAKRIANAAASKAGLTAGSLALPPGPLGWLTVLPELVMIWKIQAQMVSDIASTFGKEATLGREQMLYCLFRHTAAQAFRDVVIRMGDRLVFRRAGMAALERIAKNIGIGVSRRAVGKGISRWLPVVGALGVGAYAYYDTAQVAKTAIDLFSGGIEVEAVDVTPVSAAVATVRKSATKAAKKASATKKAVKTAVKKTVRKTAAVAKKATRKKPTA
jgi:hypothetical protein